MWEIWFHHKKKSRCLNRNFQEVFRNWMPLKNSGKLSSITTLQLQVIRLLTKTLKVSKADRSFDYRILSLSRTSLTEDPSKLWVRVIVRTITLRLNLKKIKRLEVSSLKISARAQRLEMILSKNCFKSMKVPGRAFCRAQLWRVPKQSYLLLKE